MCMYIYIYTRVIVCAFYPFVIMLGNVICKCKINGEGNTGYIKMVTK